MNHPNRNKRKILFALIQSGYCVFGVGTTYEACLLDASNCLEPDENGSFTPERIESELICNASSQVDGSFDVIEPDHPEFESYLKNQCAFEKRGKDWYDSNA